MPLADDGLSGYSERKPTVDWPTNGVQNDQVMVEAGDADQIIRIMEKIRRFEKRMVEMQIEALNS